MARAPRKTKKNGAPKKKTGPKGPYNQKQATIEKKLQILDAMAKNNWSQAQTARYFRELQMPITQASISRWKQDEGKLRKKVAKGPFAGKMRRVQQVRNPELEEVLVAWVLAREGNGEIVTGPLIKEKAGRFAARMGVEGMAFSEGWLDKFKKRHGLKRRQRHGEAASVDIKDAEEERKRLQPILSKYKPEDVWNFDETAFHWRQLYSWSLGSKNLSGTKLDKSRLTVLVGTNMTGTEKFPLLFIGKSGQPQCFKKATAKALGFDYHFNKKAWMTSGIFSSFMRGFERKMVREKRHCLVLLDNFSGHQWDEDDVVQTNVEFFHPNLTPYVQPMDAGIIRAPKAKYKHAILERSLDLEEAGATDIFKLDQLQAMRILVDAWDDVPVETIANCWKHTGIIPSIQEYV